MEKIIIYQYIDVGKIGTVRLNPRFDLLKSHNILQDSLSYITKMYHGISKRLVNKIYYRLKIYCVFIRSHFMDFFEIKFFAYNIYYNLLEQSIITLNKCHINNILLAVRTTSDTMFYC